MTIKEFNQQAYKDILKDMQRLGTTTYTFTLTINAGNIVDYVHMETVKYTKANGKQSLVDRIDTDTGVPRKNT